MLIADCDRACAYFLLGGKVQKCSHSRGVLHLPFFFVLMPLHVQRLGIYKIAAQDDCTGLCKSEDLLSKQAAD